MHNNIQSVYYNNMGLGSVLDVALASEAEGCGFDPRLDAMFLPQHVDPPISWVVIWLWSVVKPLELSEIRRYISLQIIIIINSLNVNVSLLN